MSASFWRDMPVLQMVGDLSSSDVVTSQGFRIRVYLHLAETVAGCTVSGIHRVFHKGYAQHG